MKTISALLVAVIVCGANAQELSITKLTVPVFDGAGHMTQRLTAESGSGTFEMPTLKQGVVEFLAADGTSAKVATFSFDDAVFRRPIGVVSGEGHASYRSETGGLSGNGFQYRLSDGHLELKSHVVLSLGAMLIEGQQGEAFLSQISPGKEWIVAKAKIDGGVVITGIDAEKYKFDKAETASIVYTETDGVLILASPVTCWSGTSKMVTEANELKIINVPSKRKQSPGPSPDAVH